jgi:hypothetical protein
VEILKRFDPCAMKLALRTKYRERCLTAPARSYQEALDRSRDFWPSYEQINRDFDPDDPVYSITRAGAALSTTADHLHLKAAAAGSLRILEIILGGEATTSAVNRIAFERENATLAGASAITPEKFNAKSGAATGTYGSGNTSAILTAATYFYVWAINAFGGFIDEKMIPGAEPQLNDAEVAGIRSLSGTSTFSSTIVFEEL